MQFKSFFLAALAAMLLTGCIHSPSHYVNPLVGTDFHGHTYPGAIVPFGQIQPSPDTRLDTWDGCSGYHYSDNTLYGFSHTHLNGTGCLEAYTSARGIVQTYVELRRERGCAAEPPNPSDWIQPGVADSDITSKMIGDAANAGDPLAVETYRKTGWWLGLACANACTFSAPQAMFLMGGPTKVGTPLLEPLKASFEEHLLNIYRGTCDIRMSQLKANEVAILGAAALIQLRIKN